MLISLRLRQSLVIAGTSALLTFVPACISTEVFAPEQLPELRDRDIAIITRDGRTISMTAGSYSVVESDSGAVLDGHGTMISDSLESVAKPLGSITQQIVVESRVTPFYYGTSI
jgi:hypothetical protein